MGNVTEKYNVVHYYPEAVGFSIWRGDSGIEIGDGTIKMRLYNAAGDQVGISKFPFDATQAEKDALLARLVLRRDDYETAEGLTLLPPEGE